MKRIGQKSETKDTENQKPVEICNECGKSVAPGSGRFVNRTPDFNDPEYRKEMCKPYPDGDYICSECEHKSSPPTCPRCNSLLYEVVEVTTYDYNSETGKYYTRKAKVLCGECGRYVTEVFSEGVHEYSRMNDTVHSKETRNGN